MNWPTTSTTTSVRQVGTRTAVEELLSLLMGDIESRVPTLF